MATAAKPQPSTSIEDIDEALKRYYDLMKRGDDYDNLFLEWCNENGYDEILNDDEFFDANSDSAAFDFLDEYPNFPWIKQYSTEEAKTRFVKLLNKIRKNKNYSFDEEMHTFEPLQVTADIYRSVTEQDIAKVNQLHAQQCRTIFDTEMHHDVSVNKLLAVGAKLNAPYLQYVADLYSRDRVTMFLEEGKAIEVQEWAQMNKHCKQIKKDMGLSALQEIQHAITSFYYRVVPKLLLSVTSEIQDSLEVTARYIAAQIDFVHNLVMQNELSCPFQFDACLAFNDVKLKEHIASVQDESDDDDEDDDDDDDDGAGGDEQKQDDQAFVDCFGNVKQKLDAEKCLRRAVPLDVDGKKDETKSSSSSSGPGRTAFLMRTFKAHFDAFKSEKIKGKYKDKEYEEYPRMHRMCALVDRRRPDGDQKNDDKKGTIDRDELIFFEPPDNCNSMPGNNLVPLWYFDSSKTCIIPNIGYNKNAKLKGTGNSEDVQTRPDETNITSGFHCKGALLVLSFHVISVQEIRAYMYLNGQVCRFLPQDIIQLLPRYFVQNAQNTKWAKSEAAQDLVTSMKSKLVDRKFEAFLNEYQYKK